MCKRSQKGQQCSEGHVQGMGQAVPTNRRESEELQRSELSGACFN